MRTVTTSTAFFLACCAAPGLLGGWRYCVYGCGVAMTALRWPQFIELVRERDASGVSAGSWFFGVACSVLWIIYYADVHLWAPFISTTCAGLSSLVVGCMTVWRHRQMSRELVAAEVFA